MKLKVVKRPSSSVWYCRQPFGGLGEKRLRLDTLQLSMVSYVNWDPHGIWLAFNSHVRTVEAPVKAKLSVTLSEQAAPMST